MMELTGQILLKLAGKELLLLSIVHKTNMLKVNGEISKLFGLIFLATCLITAFVTSASAEVTRLEIIKRVDWINGKSLGAAGAYEMIYGRVHYAVNPDEAANKNIVDLVLVPRNKDGLVEFSGDFTVLRPKDLSKARGSVILEVANRGNSSMVFFFNPSAGSRVLPDLSTISNLGDAFIFDKGFTVAWVGWQFDVPEGRGTRLNVPVADVSSNVRANYIHNKEQAATSFPLKQGGGYCAADPDQPDAELTVRESMDGTPSGIPRDYWAFARDESGKSVTDPCFIRVSKPFESKRIYEVVYRAQGSPIAGLGFAAVRDFAAYLKYGPKDGVLRERPETLATTIGFGLSQTGRFLRQFVYEGFNADERKRKVFDGLLITLAGAGRGSFNHRFANPGQAGNSVLDVLRPVDLFPFTDLPQKDPLTGAKDGLLLRADRQKVTPKIFYIYSSTEYWARFGSLTHTDTAGTEDVALHPSTRLYFVAGTPHVARAFPARRDYGEIRFENLANPVAPKFAFRALLIGLDEWVNKDLNPPESSYPTLKNKELVSLSSAAFPRFPELAFPTYLPKNWRMDYGRDFLRTGVMTSVRPTLGEPYTILLPRVDADGNERSGIRLPHIAVPVATYTGWNYETPRLEKMNYLGGLTGTILPFPRTAEERAATGDSRLSLIERYGTREDFLARVRTSAETLAKQRYVLPEDVNELMQQGGRLWDYVMGTR
jgi:hypothetical protein